MNLKAMIVAALAAISAVEPACAKVVTPPGTWLKVIKDTIRQDLGDLEYAKFSRIFFDKEKMAEGGYPVCGKLISKRRSDSSSRTWFFYGIIRLPGDFNAPVFTDVRIGLTESDMQKVAQSCLGHGLI